VVCGGAGRFVDEKGTETVVEVKLVIIGTELVASSDMSVCGVMKDERKETNEGVLNYDNEGAIIRG